MAFVYWVHLPEHTDITSQGYIGFTSRTVESRWKGHKDDAKRRPHVALYKALAKYGDKLIVTTLVEGSNEYCLDVELKLRPTPKIGWNLNIGGERGSLGTVRSKESCEKQSKTMTGVIRPQSHRDNLSKALTGIPKSEAHCKAMSEYNKQLKPWQNGRADKEMWAIADVFQLYYKSNLSHGALKMAQSFDLRINKVAKILTKLRTGWNPSEDAEWLAFKEAYKNKEASETTSTN